MTNKTELSLECRVGADLRRSIIASDIQTALLQKICKKCIKIEYDRVLPDKNGSDPMAVIGAACRTMMSTENADAAAFLLQRLSAMQYMVRTIDRAFKCFQEGYHAWRSHIASNSTEYAPTVLIMNPLNWDCHICVDQLLHSQDAAVRLKMYDILKDVYDLEPHISYMDPIGATPDATSPLVPGMYRINLSYENRCNERYKFFSSLFIIDPMAIADEYHNKFLPLEYQEPENVQLDDLHNLISSTRQFEKKYRTAFLQMVRDFVPSAAGQYGYHASDSVLWFSPAHHSRMNTHKRAAKTMANTMINTLPAIL